jgi:DNA polymerase-4
VNVWTGAGEAMAADRPASAAGARVRRILHVDVDAMFVQCAVLADPERLAAEPLILVGGSPDGRGVVTSASYGCRSFGVRSAMPMATALRLCPDALVVRVPGAMIRSKSHELAEALEGWAPVMAMASVDEAYLDLTGTEAVYRHEPLAATARAIQLEVREKVGLDVSVGGGSNRLVAKLATSFAKPRGVFVVPAGEEEEFVGRLRLGDLIGVGPAFEAALRRRGITSMRSLRALDISTMAAWWGEDRASWLWRRCRGIDESPVADHSASRSVSSETTFRRDVESDADLEEALLAQIVDASASLRRKGLFARTITVKLRYADFQDRSRSRTVEAPIQTERAIFVVARELLADLRGRRGGRVRLVGIGLTNLDTAGYNAQGQFLEVAPPAESERDRALARAADGLRTRFGRDAVRPGRLIHPARGRLKGR